MDAIASNSQMLGKGFARFIKQESGFAGIGWQLCAISPRLAKNSPKCLNYGRVKWSF
jgi:hypothetical protein